MSMEYKLPLTAKEVEEVLVKGKEVLPNIEEYKGLEYIGTINVARSSGTTLWESLLAYEVTPEQILILRNARFAKFPYEDNGCAIAPIAYCEWSKNKFEIPDNYAHFLETIDDNGKSYFAVSGAFKDSFAAQHMDFYSVELYR